MAINNKWKVIAWVFIALFILETVAVGTIYKIGFDQLKREAKCSNEICYNLNSSAFNYDSSTETCSCMNNNQVIHREILK